MITAGNGAQVQQTRLEKETYLFRKKLTVFLIREQLLVWQMMTWLFEKYARTECRTALQNSEHRRRNNVVVWPGNQSCSINLE